MLKKALIIGGSSIPGENYIAGVEADLAAYHKFLCSDAGGAWNESEVTVIDNPPASKVISLLKGITADFLFFVFSGHGYQKEEKGDVLMCLNCGEIGASALYGVSKKVSAVLDCCRSIPPQVIATESRKSRISAAVDVPYRARQRALYEKSVLDAEAGTSILYSCSEKEGAEDEHPIFGSFSQALVNEANRWYESITNNRVDDIYSMRDAHAAAFNAVKKAQTPVLNDGRRMIAFPFAVKAR